MDTVLLQRQKSECLHTTLNSSPFREAHHLEVASMLYVHTLLYHVELLYHRSANTAMVAHRLEIYVSSHTHTSKKQKNWRRLFVIPEKLAENVHKSQRQDFATKVC